MRHGPFGSFHQHGEDVFLQRKAQIFRSVLATSDQFLRFLLNIREDPTEGHIHPFHHIRQRQELGPFFGGLFYIVTGAKSCLWS